MTNGEFAKSEIVGNEYPSGISGRSEDFWIGPAWTHLLGIGNIQPSRAQFLHYFGSDTLICEEQCHIRYSAAAMLSCAR